MSKKLSLFNDVNVSTKVRALHFANTKSLSMPWRHHSCVPCGDAWKCLHGWRFSPLGRRLLEHGLVTLTYYLRGHGACRWYGFSCCICSPSLKFVGFPIRKIWNTFCDSFNQNGDLDLWPWNWCVILPMAWRGQLSYQFWCFWDFLFWTFGPTATRCTTWHRDLDLGGHGAHRWYRSSCSICVPSL